jgi:hypothetical protein
MAAAITTTATTIEKQLFEVAGKIQELEVAAAAADTTGEFQPLMTVAVDAEGGAVTITATLPAAISSVGGVLTFTPDEYL